MTTPAKPAPSTALQPARPSAIGTMARRLNVDPDKLLGTLQETCFKGASNEQMMALVIVSNEYGLNPFTKEIYAFPAKGGGIVPVISIDGWVKMANRHELFDGIEFEWEEREGGGLPFACTAIIHLKGRSRPVKVTEHFDECVRATEPWKQMPRRMLRHKALIQCARVAFGFSGAHDEDEAKDIIAVTGTVVETTAQPLRPLPRVVEAPKGEEDFSPAASTNPARAEFQKMMQENEIPFTAVQKWGIDSGNIPDADSMASLDEIHEDILKRLLRSKVGLLSGLKSAKASLA